MARSRRLELYANTYRHIAIYMASCIINKLRNYSSGRQVTLCKAGSDDE